MKLWILLSCFLLTKAIPIAQDPYGSPYQEPENPYQEPETEEPYKEPEPETEAYEVRFY